MAVGDLFRSYIAFEHNAEQGGITLDYEQVDPDTIGDPCGLLSLAIATDLVPAIQNVQSEEVQSLSVYSRPWIRDTFNPGLNTLVGQNGNRTGSPQPFINCALLSLLQSLRGAKHNGRAFLPGVSEDDTANGLLDLAAIGAPIAALETALRTPVAQDDAGGTVTFRPVVVGFLVLPPPTPPQLIPSPVTGAVVKEILSRQRRRRSKVLGVGP